MTRDRLPQPALPIDEAAFDSDGEITARRWLLCGALIIALHAALLVGLLPRKATPIESPPPPISIDLAPQTPKPAIETPSTAETQPVPTAAAPAPAPAPPKIEPALRPTRAAKPARLPRDATPKEQAPPAPAPVLHQPLNLTPNFSQHTPSDLTSAPESEDRAGELENYRQVLTAYVIRHAVYPASALLLHQQGIVYVDFVIDRDGRILGHHLGHSSGIAVIDAEALAIFEREQPFPAIPSDLEAPLSLTMPFRFVLPH